MPIGPQTVSEEKVSTINDCEQAVKSLGCPYHGEFFKPYTVYESGTLLQFSSLQCNFGIMVRKDARNYVQKTAQG